MKLNELLSKIPKPPYERRGNRIYDNPSPETIGSAECIAEIHGNEACNKAAYLVHAANQFPALFAALRDVLVWQQTFEQGECRRSDLEESLTDARKAIAAAETIS